MSIAIRPTTAPDDDHDREEIVRLELLRRLAMGAAHTLNNAFTGILGETLCLLDERKGDPAVVEACGVIQNEVERCARLTRLVALRAQTREPLLDEADLGALLRGVEALLRETVSRSLAIRIATPEPGLCVRGSVEDCELLVLSVALRLVREHTGGGALEIDVVPGAHAIDVVVALRADPPAVASAEPGWQRTVRTALDGIAARIGACVVADGAHAARIRLLRAEER